MQLLRKILCQLVGVFALFSTHASADPIVGRVPVIRHPSALAIYPEANLLFVNNYGDSLRQIYVIDITAPGSEKVIDAIQSPIEPHDLEIAFDDLYVIGYRHDVLYWFSVSQRSWNEIALSSTVVEPGFKKTMSLRDGKLYVLHRESPHAIDVIDPVPHTLERTIPLSPRSAHEISFVGNYLVSLSTSLDAAYCEATGPHLYLYSFPDMGEIYSVDVHGFCWQGVTAVGDQINLISQEHVEARDLLTGELRDTLYLPDESILFGPPTQGPAGSYLVTTYLPVETTGTLLKVNNPSDYICDSIRVAIVGDFPAIHQARYSPIHGDDRLFVANWNDNSVSIIYNWTTCPEPR